jgi:hypothetical protein
MEPLGDHHLLHLPPVGLLVGVAHLAPGTAAGEAVLLQFEAALGPIVPLLDGAVGVKALEVVPVHVSF